ncbi:Major Facilitator Superfamily protein [Mycobacterium sp. THAF192]|nr:Major Facilitator Superfamily protein [Mycobacterium sp. THAF192]
MHRSNFELPSSAGALALSVYAFALIPAMLVFDPLSDRYERRWAIVVALVLAQSVAAIAICVPRFPALVPLWGAWSV